MIGNLHLSLSTTLGLPQTSIITLAEIHIFQKYQTYVMPLLLRYLFITTRGWLLDWKIRNSNG